jgi:UDP-2,3-diacylglucosamine hydrolase
MLYKYAKRKASELPEVDFFVFGHLHIPMLKKISDKAELIILGDWISNFSYGVFEDGKMRLEFYNEDN